MTCYSLLLIEPYCDKALFVVVTKSISNVIDDNNDDVDANDNDDDDYFLFSYWAETTHTHSYVSILSYGTFTPKPYMQFQYLTIGTYFDNNKPFFKRQSYLNKYAILSN